MKSERDPERRQEIAEINANEDFSQREKKVMIELSKYETIEELEAAVGEITGEEKEMLDSINLFADPTPEELEALGPDFTKRLIEKAQKRISNSEQLPNK